MICGYCGASNAEGSEYCKKCGCELSSQLIVQESVCANHPAKIATSICMVCGVELCEQCENFVDDAVYCTDCLNTPFEIDEADQGQFVCVDAETYAPFGFRLLAGFLDMAVIACCGLALAALLWFITGNPAAALDSGSRWFSPYWFALSLGTAGYFIGFVAVSAQTPGMTALDLVVVCADGASVDWSRATARYLASVLSLMLVFGLFMPLWDRKRRAWHDKIARTVMVKVG